MRGAVSAANYVSNSDPEEIIANCSERLNQGSNLILFPEGTRRDQSEPFKFKLGAAAIAVRSQAAILPIYIECQPATLRKGEAWYHIPRTRPHWVFEIPSPLSVDDLTAGERKRRIATRKLQAALVQHYELRRANDRACNGFADGDDAGSGPL
jgi:1-acyl-sn-glycerol-3-phosphate acyltransferase